MIYKDGESDAQKKTVNEETEIDSLYTSYEINYLSFATKSGRLQSENAGFDYFTSGDLVGL